MSWTNEQLNAINARDTGVIVSAAAGSGKTSVLVERLLRILSDTENKIPADRLIVVTFTNDAAAQMKQRLSAALSEKIGKEPDNLWLCSQQALLQTAKISTIHSFCFDLIRENIRFLDVSAGFRILDDAEEELIKRQAAENTFEIFYSKYPEKINRLADFFSGKERGDTELEEALLKIYDFLMSIPYYDSWLKEKTDFWKSGFSPDTDPFAEVYLNKLESTYRNVLRKTEYVGDWYLREFDKTSDAITEETDRVKLMIKNISTAEYDWDKRVIPPVPAKKSISFPRNMDDLHKEIAEKIKDIRNGYKDTLDKISKNIFTFEEINSDYEIHGSVMTDLCDMINVFAEELSKIKADKNALGFSDAEQLTIKLLTDMDENGVIRRTALAEELSAYYSMIMIDEFQDANNNQDLIFKILSKGGTPERGGTNLFVVGDVKQSIYRFRLANPKLFIDALEKSDEYTGDDFPGTNAAVFLNRNFRSSEQVIDFVNYIFGNLMSRTAGEVDYTEAEALVKGLEYPEADRTTEFIIVPTEDIDSDEDGNPLDEAYAAAQKISSMIGVKTVYDKGEMRPCEPRDFCILLRGKAEAETYVMALAKRNVKAHAEEPEGYLESREISVLINLLAVVDNPMQNIPLVSVLMSPMFMLTAEDMAELAVIKGKDEEKYFRVIKNILAGEIETEKSSALYMKLERFMKVFEKLRYCASSQRLERFIRTIYDSTDFLSAVQVFRDGSQKRANLRLLLEVAESYEKNSNGGISGFVRYVDMIIRKKSDLKRASTVSAADNAVSIKTIHKSKGLEYPFVFLCGTSKKFNESDVNSRMIINSDYGISFKIQNREKLKSYNSFPLYVMRKIERDNLASEEMRLFYVALTRAREQLFITVPDSEKVRKRIASISDEIIVSGGLTADMISAGNSMLYWIAATMLIHPNGEWFRDGAFVSQVSDAPDVCFTKVIPDSRADEEDELPTALPDEEQVKQLSEIFNFRYDSDLLDKSAKITVTEIAKSSGDDKLYLRRPDFVSEKGQLTAAEKGTAMHIFMQYADYAAAEGNPSAEAERLSIMGLLTEEERVSLNLKQLSEFFESDLYSRMKKSDNVRREQKFLIKKSDAALDDERLMSYNNSSMLQGIADCMFDEGDGIVIIDYKTDRVSSEGVLASRYDLQLKLYSAALGKIFGKPVKEAYLYSFALGKAVRIV